MAPTVALSALLAADISDPTDFPAFGITPGLRALDTALRCTICSEFFDAPVSLACGHCFCSLCARGAISEKAECPACRKSAAETHLRVDPAIEEIVAAWKAARSFVLQLMKAEEDRRSRLSSSVNSTPSRPDKKRKRYKYAEMSDDESDDEVTAGLSHPPLRAGGSSSSSEARGVDSTVGFSTAPPSNSRKKRSNTRSPFSEEEVPMSDDPTFVQCPVCEVFVGMDEINAHLDSGCHVTPQPTAKQQKQQWSNLFTAAKGKEKAPEERLPKASYSTLKDKQLKALLTEHKLPVTGDRLQLEARHKRWVILWNANLDRGKARKSLVDLRAELKQWEDDQARANVVTRNRTPVAEDPQEHQRRHKAEFAKLTEQARLQAKAKAVGNSKLVDGVVKM